MIVGRWAAAASFSIGASSFMLYLDILIVRRLRPGACTSVRTL